MSLDPDEPPEVVQGPKAPIQPLDLDETADVVRLPKGPVHSPSSDSILSICSLAEVPQDGQSSCAKIDLNNPSEHKDWVVVKTVQQSGCTERALVLYNAEDNRYDYLGSGGLWQEDFVVFVHYGPRVGG